MLAAGAAGMAMFAPAIFAQESGDLRGLLTDQPLKRSPLKDALQAADALVESPLQPDTAATPLYPNGEGTGLTDGQGLQNADGSTAGKTTGTGADAAQNPADASGQDGQPASTDLAVANNKRVRAIQARNTAAGAANAADAEQPAYTGAAGTASTTGSRAKVAGQDVTSTGTVRQRTVDYGDAEDFQRARPDNQPATPVELATRHADDNPYAATGIRAGSFILRPSLESGIEWTSNAEEASGGSAAVVSETTLRLNAQSDWSSHSASLDAYGTWRKSLSGAQLDELTAGADAALRLDLDHEFTLNGTAGYSRAPEAASSPVAITGVAERPIRQTLSASAGVEKGVGKFRLSLTGNATRDIYGDARLTAGGTLSQSDRNNTLATATLRAGYEVSPAVTPFVEAEYGRRLYDERLDSAGYARSSNRLGMRGGVDLDFGEKLNGEVSAGWVSEDFDDARLATLSGFTAAANFDWSPVRGTTVALTGSTTVEGTTTAGESGSILYSSQLSVTRELRANLTGTALVGAEWRDYSGSSDHDLTLAAETSLTWWLNRNLGITGRARHERLTSTIAGRDYEATSGFLGVKLQR